MRTKTSVEKLLYLPVLIALALIFLYQLGAAPLQSYDEAWYADITRNLAQNKNPFELQFNGSRFTDHPPMGFLLMSVPTFFMGSNEFSARLIAALSGLGSIILIFLVGRKVGGKYVGISAAAILLSSMWFMLRARSGNLDIPFLFISLLCISSATKIDKSRKYLYLTSAFFAALFMTKTLIGIVILPVLAYLIWKNRAKLRHSMVVKAIIIWLILVLPWYVYNQAAVPTFLQHHFFEIGSRGETNTFAIRFLPQSLYYIQVGIGKWFKPLIFSAALSLLFWFKNKHLRSKLNVIYLYLLGFLLPFIFSSKAEVWHFIPTYPAIALLISFILNEVVKISAFSSYKLVKYIPVILITFLAAFQFNQFSNLIYSSITHTSSEKEISLKAGNFSKIYLMETFYPAAVYYSQSKVMPLYWEKEAFEKMITMLNSDQEYIFLINKEFATKLAKRNVEFELLDSVDNYLIIQ